MNARTMQADSRSKKQLILEVERLRQERERLQQEKTDLEIMLETVTTHADTIEAQLHESNQQLQVEIGDRQRTEAALQSLLAIATRHVRDLEILLETTTEHGDLIGSLLYDKAEETARNSERKLAQFLEAMPVAVIVLDTETRLYYSNQRAQQLVGKSALVGVSSKPLAEIFRVYRAGTNTPYPIEDLICMRALRGETATADDMEIHLGDRTIPIESWGTPIFDDNGNVTYAIIAFQDITERKQAEAESQKFTSELFQLNEAFSRFVPRQFLQLLDKESIVDVQLGDQVQQDMSVLFSDIRDFTDLSERMTPEDNFKFINSYLSRMEPAIVKNQGFIDKYIGDGIMALFSGEADNAVKAGIAMLQELTTYNQHRASHGYVPIQIGIGINTGSLMLGTVGGSNRMDSTVISDTVNLASRLEGLTKEYGVSLLVSHHTFAQLQDANQYVFRIIDRVQVKGKSKAVSVYEIFDGDPPKIRDRKLATKTAFEEALLLYNFHAFRDAARLFKDCLRINPGDRVARIHLECCKRLDSTLRAKFPRL
jgi:class 3 adenylate cyclase/PAS domain-containing protein